MFNYFFINRGMNKQEFLKNSVCFNSKLTQHGLFHENLIIIIYTHNQKYTCSIHSVQAMYVQLTTITYFTDKSCAYALGSFSPARHDRGQVSLALIVAIEFKMAEKGGILPIEAATQSGGTGSSRESSPEDAVEHRMSSMQQHSMDSLILSGESSDDILIDELLDDEEEEEGSCGEEEEEEEEEGETSSRRRDPEAMTMAATEGSDDQSRVTSTTGAGGSVATATGGRSGGARGPHNNTTASGAAQEEEEVVEVASTARQQQKRNKKKRRISSTRERKISISSSRVKV